MQQCMRFCMQRNEPCSNAVIHQSGHSARSASVTHTSISNTLIVQAHFPERDINLLIYRPFDADIFLQQLRAVVPATVIDQPLDAVAETIEGVVGWHIPFSILESLVTLRWIQTTSSGTDHLTDFLQQTNRQIMLSTVRGMNAAVVAEFALMAVLAHKWHLSSFQQQQAQRVWQ